VFDVEEVIAHTVFAATDATLSDLKSGLTTRELNAARSTPPLADLWAAYSVGSLSSDAYWGRILQHVGIAGGDAVETYRSTLRSAWWGHFDQAVLDLIAQLRERGVAVGLLSNSAPEHDERLALLEPLVDVAHFSHRTGHRKPHPQAYLGIAAALGVSPNEVFFTDDKVRNTEAAQGLGMRAEVFRGAEPLRAALQAAGLL
jgi:putative hydrolase of the HAD superfamily